MSDLTFILNVIQSNTTVPVILTNGKEISGSRNLDTLFEKDTSYVRKQLDVMKKELRAN
jgi:hypothetical protein